VQAAKLAPSSLHSKETPARLSLNVNVAVASVVGFAGCPVSVGAGGDEIVHEDVVVEPVPLALTARTRKVWVPKLRGPAYSCGLVQATKLAPSSLHWKLAVGSPSVKTNVALRLKVGFVGPDTIAGAGGTAATASTVIGFRAAAEVDRLEVFSTVDLEVLSTLDAAAPRTLAGFGVFSPPRLVGACWGPPARS